MPCILKVHKSLKLKMEAQRRYFERFTKFKQHNINKTSITNPNHRILVSALCDGNPETSMKENSCESDSEADNNTFETQSLMFPAPKRLRVEENIDETALSKRINLISLDDYESYNLAQNLLFPEGNNINFIWNHTEVCSSIALPSFL